MPVNEVRKILMAHERRQVETIISARRANDMILAGMAGELAAQHAQLVNDLERESARAEALNKVQVSTSPAFSNRSVPMKVASVTVADGGSGYDKADTVGFSGGGGSGAAGKLSVDANGVVTGVSVTNGGTGYTSPPTVSVMSDAGAGALLTAVIL